MLIDTNKVHQFYIVCGKTDLRRGIDGLAAIVQQQFELDPYNQIAVPILWYSEGPIQSVVLGW